MNHETAVAMAVVLAVIVITILYAMISGGLDIGDQGVENLTDRADGDGSPSFANFESGEASSFEELSIKTGSHNYSV